MNAHLWPDLIRDAARYEGAMRAIGRIASMNLETQEGLKAALSVVAQEGANLRFHLPKLIGLAVNDAAFTASIKRAAPDSATAVALLKRSVANPSTIYALPGARALAGRLKQSVEADLLILASVSQRFRRAAKKKDNSGADSPFPPGWNPVLIANDFQDLVMLVALLAAVAGLVAFAELMRELATLFRFMKAIEECQERAGMKRTRCLALADAVRDSPELSRAAQAQCGLDWSIEAPMCTFKVVSAFLQAGLLRVEAGRIVSA